MSLMILQHHVGDVVILQLQGMMAIGEDSDFLKKRIAELVGGRHTQIVFDLGNCLYISADCRETLPWCRALTQEKGGDCRLMNLGLQQVFMFTSWGEYSTFQTFKTLESAVQSFE